MTGEPLRIDGLNNIRDLAGLATDEGRTVRPGQVYRSDNLIGLTAEGRQDLLGRVRPRTVIDLRMDIESDALAYELADSQVEILRCPMIPQSGITPEQIEAGGADNLVEDYLRQLEVNAGSIVAALEAIADPERRPVVVHCTAGKDRTGIVIAMLLGLLGIDGEDIVADYHATTPNMAPIVDRIRAARVYQETGLAAAPDWIFASEPETMRAFLAELDARYGSAQEWAMAKGMPARAIEDLREGLLAR